MTCTAIKCHSCDCRKEQLAKVERQRDEARAEVKRVVNKYELDMGYMEGMAKGFSSKLAESLAREKVMRNFLEFITSGHDSRCSYLDSSCVQCMAREVLKEALAATAEREKV